MMRFAYRFGLLAPIGLLLALLLGACNTFTDNAEIGDRETEIFQLKGTIEGMGDPAEVATLQQAATQNSMLQAELNGWQVTALAAQGTLAALERAGGIVAQPATPPPAGAVEQTPDGQPPAAPTPDDLQTSFSQPVTATGVRNEDGCASGPTTIFDATEDQIYVVTRISNLKAGSVFSARWLANGSLFFDDTQCWIPAQDWASVCAYCSIVPDGPTFQAGNWSVELLLDGQLFSQAQFQVVEPSQPEGEVNG